ncbi:MAG: hypothetical protein AAB966_03255 [Patescibacteria group bacterium]
MKIDIEIINDSHFKDIATLIDRPDYIRAVDKIRAKWKLTDRFDVKNFKTFYAYIWGEDVNETSWNEFLTDVAHLRSIFYKSPNFDKVIIYSIAFNKIPNYAYRSCYIKAEPIDPSENGSDDHQYSIVFSSETTRNEIQDEFNKFKNGISGKTSGQLMNKEDEGYDWDVFPTEKIKDHTAPNIKRDRDWYWLKKEGNLSYQEILERAGVGYTEKDSVVKAIKGYKDRLV